LHKLWITPQKQELILVIVVTLATVANKKVNTSTNTHMHIWILLLTPAILFACLLSLSVLPTLPGAKKSTSTFKNS